ncbi:helix-turn-helix domain-containing protein [Puia sp. P3]|uniref:helix-turn-helix domain-containing protein n=1 Tax=Puia sp. P3 TaxID=3423952 RepID=UPI003D66E02E
MFIRLDKKEQGKMELLFQVFLDEFEDRDHIQGEMMQVLLKRLIIIITRLAKRQYLNEAALTEDKLDLVRQYNLLVEKNYKKEHQVKFYADRLNKSPKTLSNVFALYNHKSPQQVIHERVLQEAKRLLFYTGKSAKEVAADMGFEDATHFSKFFKKKSGTTPSEFRKRTPMTFPIDLKIGGISLNLHIIFETLGFFVGFRYFLFLRGRQQDTIGERNRTWIIIGASFRRPRRLTPRGRLRKPLGPFTFPPPFTIPLRQ